MTTTQEHLSIALGFFDGVHRGHAALLDEVKKGDGVASVLTFQQHPSSLLKEKTTPLLTNTEDRKWILSQYYDIHNILVLDFPKICSLPWEVFLEDFLIRQQNARQIVVGHDFRFGKNGEGTAEKLLSKCTTLGVSAKVLAPITLDDKIISSTYIRSLLEIGNMEEATRFLGHPHVLSNRVQHGNKIGKNQLGFPTVNLAVPSDVIIPRFGVYACRVWVGEQCFHAVTNIGIRPTVLHEATKEVSVEGYLLDFPDQDLYGEYLIMEFYTFLRAEQKFDNFSDLSKQIENDVKSTRSYFNI